jgi:hypothetical protein
MGERRRLPIFLYGLMALLVNPFRPFHLSPEMVTVADKMALVRP